MIDVLKATKQFLSTSPITDINMHISKNLTPTCDALFSSCMFINDDRV